MSDLMLELYSEPYAPTGNIGDSGFRKLLGTPSLDVMQTVVREAIQNCCDAAKLGKGPEILLRLRTLDVKEIAVMRNQVFRELPKSDSSRTDLARFLESSAPIVMEICDFGTTGLGGPTRADRLPPGTSETDFIDFLRNVGTSRDTYQGGGTYGFGKVSLYMASKASTILVDTLCSTGGAGNRRLMACHLGPATSTIAEDGSQHRYTGRHWWGQLDKSEHTAFAEPLLDDVASELSVSLGMPARAGHRTGTSIMIVDPRLGSGSLLDASELLVQSILWNFWPRMMQDVPTNKRIVVNIEVEGQRISLPDPETYPPLDLFTRAMRHLREGSSETTSILCQRPAKVLGKLAIQKGVKAQRVAVTSDDTIIPTTANHIAVMRPVELVVRYFEGDPLPDPAVEWAGVFLSSAEEEVERAFAESEPPAHDDWQPGILETRRARTFVNVAIREIRKAGKAVAVPIIERMEADSSGGTLASVAKVMGSALSNFTEKQDGARGSRKRTVTKRNAQVGPVRAMGLVATAKGTVARFGAAVNSTSQNTGLVASPRLALDNGTAGSDIVDPDRIPEVISVETTNGPLQLNRDSWSLGKYSGHLIVSVLVPDLCAVSLSLSTKET